MESHVVNNGTLECKWSGKEKYTMNAMKLMKSLGVRIWLPIFILVVWMPCSVWAQQAASTQTPKIAGPEGVAQKLKSEEDPTSVFPQPSWLKPYDGWKKQLKDAYGLSFGLSAYWLYQKANESQGDDDALGGIYRFQGSWVAFARDSSHSGRLEWRVENRSAVGSFQSPSQLSGEVGAAALNTGFGYSHNFSTDLSVLNWTQTFLDHRAGFAVGRLAFDVYLDAFMFQTFSRGFLNRAFLVNPTMGTTGIGALGTVGKGFVTDNILIGGQIYDGNAASGEFDFDTFEEHEWLKAMEIAWAPSAARYKTDRIQFTYWDKDERQKAGVPRGSGWVVSASYQVGDGFIPFTRFGHSDGGAGVAAESAASVGFELSPRNDQAWSLGFGWAKPNDKNSGLDRDDEYVIETSYKVQIWPFMSLTPDLQLLLNPANHPDESSVWIAGLRAILTL
jgi:porin